MLRKIVITTFGLSILGILCLTLAVMAAPGNSPIADAAQQGDRNAVRSQLKQGLDVNAPQGDGMTALHWAAATGDTEMAQMLIYAGANLKAATRVGGYTPLLLASKNGNAAVVETLLKAGDNPNSTTTLGVTALMFAAESGSSEAVKALVDHNAQVNAQESAHGQTALILAAAYNRADVIKALIQHGADPSIVTKVSIPPEFVKDGMENRIIVPPQYGGKPIEEQKKLTEEEIKANSYQGSGGGGGLNRRPAKADAQDKDNSAAQSYRGIEPDPLGGLTPLHYAAREGYEESVRALIAQGVNVNQVTAGDHTSPLLIAALNGRYDIARLLLEHGADPNIASAAGQTPLYATLNVQWARMSFYPQPTSQKQQKTSHVELLRDLLDHGANPNMKLKKGLWMSLFNSFGTSGISEAGATPLWRAAQSSDIDAMRLLITRGADWTIPSDQGMTPMNVAAGDGWRGVLNVNAPTGWMPAFQYLADLGADINAGDADGYTPLHSAAERGDNDMILYLISKGADINAVSKTGLTVVDMANGPRTSLQPFPETLALLEILGAANSHRCVAC